MVSYRRSSVILPDYQWKGHHKTLMRGSDGDDVSIRGDEWRVKIDAVSAIGVLWRVWIDQGR
jgi:hypothetical protein